MKNDLKIKWIWFGMLISVFSFVACASNSDGGAFSSDQKKREIDSWLEKLEDQSISTLERQEALHKVYTLNTLESVDSIKIKNLRYLAYQALKINDSVFFRDVNKEAKEILEKREDTIGLAEIQWNYGAYYASREIYDSAYVHYNQAQKFYRAVRDDYFSARMLYNMAFIRGRLKDYTGSEKLIFRAISIFKRLDKYKSLYNSYNHIAIIYYELEEYNKALVYNEKAIKYHKMAKDPSIILEGTLNNIGLIYHAKGEYGRAIDFYSKALKKKNNLKNADIILYARLIDNKAYSKMYNNNTDNVLDEFKLALHIRDSIGNHSGVIISQLHLAEYHLKYKDTLSAIQFSKEAMRLAKKSKNNRDYLASLRFLAQTDETHANQYLNEFVILNDSLQKEDRKIRNKYTRIDYETDEYMERARRLSQEKILLITVGIFLLLIISLLYFINIERIKSRELLFESEQQRANEQIYLLSFKQQAKLQEGKIMERNRISEELHDGILGKLFGTRVGLGFLKPNLNQAEDKKYNVFIDELQNIEKEIRDISRELKNQNTYFTSLGFFTIIHKLLEDSSKIGGFKFELINDDNTLWDSVDEVVKANLYRILQESLQNIIKHAQAKTVHIEFMINERFILLKIMDDGIGFNTLRRYKGIGLRNMNTRTEKLNGNLTIESSFDHGTEIMVEIPLNKKK